MVHLPFPIDVDGHFQILNMTLQFCNITINIVASRNPNLLSYCCGNQKSKWVLRAVFLLEARKQCISSLVPASEVATSLGSWPSITAISASIIPSPSLPPLLPSSLVTTLSLLWWPRIISHLKNLNIITSTKAFWLCKTTCVRVLEIRTWTSLGGL